MIYKIFNLFFISQAKFLFLSFFLSSKYCSYEVYVNWIENLIKSYFRILENLFGYATSSLISVRYRWNILSITLNYSNIIFVYFIFIIQALLFYTLSLNQNLVNPKKVINVMFNIFIYLFIYLFVILFIIILLNAIKIFLF